MSGHQSQEAREAGGHAPGIFQGCIATALGAACTPLLTYCWQYYPGGKPPDWAVGVLPSAVGGVTILALWRIVRFVRHGRQSYSRRARPAQEDRIAIYVADLQGDDATRSARRRIIRTLQQEIGTDTVEVLTAGAELTLREGSTDHEADAATTSARKILRDTGGDLLIWGRLDASGAEKKLELWFVSPERAEPALRPFGFDRELQLDETFVPEMGAMLAARVAALALPATNQRGTASAYRLSPVAIRRSPGAACE